MLDMEDSLIKVCSAGLYSLIKVCMTGLYSPMKVFDGLHYHEIYDILFA